MPWDPTYTLRTPFFLLAEGPFLLDKLMDPFPSSIITLGLMFFGNPPRMEHPASEHSVLTSWCSCSLVRQLRLPYLQVEYWKDLIAGMAGILTSPNWCYLKETGTVIPVCANWISTLLFPTGLRSLDFCLVLICVPRARHILSPQQPPWMNGKLFFFLNTDTNSSLCFLFQAVTGGGGNYL